ncbi:MULTISPECIES: hypothetical protein [unclassified Kitasatospora]|uniref:hypothetical protein n=1 Tax=unclassified Kitasatospora TaxID=2633591 RepID=UPI00070C16FF|nr:MULTISPECIES: hypothetical protein [unclassified Kitasatospora]KQV17545.1 hypothetical protein ASC99_25600 [Kitasatospora sp. Root107]KRB69209.1 hypothetical protein ASE03_27575 [Kitasatospora sp. Root187]
MPFEEDFTRTLRQAADLAPDPQMSQLAIGAAGRGRQLRYRRRARLLGGTAALAAVGLAATSFLPGGVTLQPSALPSENISGAFMERTVASLLPPGQVTELKGFGTNDMSHGGPGVSFLFDDGKGTGQVSLSTDRMALPIDQDTMGTECLALDLSEGCTRTVLPDGSILVVMKAREQQPKGARKSIVIATAPTGRQVRLDAFNTVHGSLPLRDEPSLTVEQSTAVVTSEAWAPLFDQLTVPGSGRPTAPGPAPAKILTTIEALLPSGARLERPAVEQRPSGRADFKVTLDGHTSGLVVIVMPKWEGQREMFETTTPDGFSITTGERGMTKGGSGPAVFWDVDVLHPDGTRVLISESNIDANGPQPLAGAEALTMDQLQAIAANPAWRN